MATLVLQAAGAAVAGPIGAAVGAAVGFFIDRTVLFRPPGSQREGPRLEDLKVQSSALGTPIPLVYGRTRIAGNVIWSTDIKETRTETEQKTGGKGAKSSSTTVEFSYSVSLAVALSARPIVGVGRIWADGKLLRDSTGQLLSPVTIRLYQGDELQETDPLIEAMIGSTDTPGFRGLAYVVLEDLELAEFANRVPNLSFEVIADASIHLSGIVRDIAERGGADIAAIEGIDRPVIGLAVGRETEARSVLDALSATFPFMTSEGPGALSATALDRGGLMPVGIDDLGVRADDDSNPNPIIRREREQGSDMLEMLGLRHADPDRDFQTAVQWARRQQGHAFRRQTADSPLTLTAFDAKHQAEILLALSWLRRESVSLSLPTEYAELSAGDRIIVAGHFQDRAILLEEVTVSGTLVEVTGFPLSSLPGMPADSADSGAFRPPVVLPPGDTVAEILDLPGLNGSLNEARVTIAMAGPSLGWRGGAFFVSNDAGDSFDPFATSVIAATIGTVIEPPGPGPVTIMDEGSSLLVRLLRPDMTLESRSALAILNGANLAIAGDELFQFREARLEPDGTYRLTGLLRGRGGAEAAVDQHAAGERFILLDGGGLIATPLPLDSVGGSAPAKAVTLGTSPDDVVAETIGFAGRNLTPWSPVHVRASRTEQGDATITWIRRTRFDGGWRDGGDAPLNEESEAYLLEILNGGAVLRSLTLSSPHFDYSAALQAGDFGAPQPAIEIRIRQISARTGPGLPWTGFV